MSELSIRFSAPEFKRDPYPILQQAVEQPVWGSRLPMIGRTWLATQHESAQAVLKDSELFTRLPARAGKRRLPGMRWWMPRSLRVLTKNMLATDAEPHRRLRKFVDFAFQRVHVESLKPEIERLCHRQLAELERSWRTGTGSVDFVSRFSRPLPLAVICLILGLPERDQSRFSSWFEKFSNVSSVRNLAGAVGGLRRTLRYLREHVRQTRSQGGPGLVGELVRVEFGRDQLSEDELVATLFLLLAAGHETTVHLISGMLHLLLGFEDQKVRLMENWQLGDSAVNESLRLFSPVQITKPRWVTRDTQFFGQPIRRGQMMTTLLAAANLDPGTFSEPMRYDIGRQPNRHLAFGVGPHVCLGLKLAVLEASTAIHTILDAYPGIGADPTRPITWSSRLGMRSMASFPVILSSNSSC